LFEKIRCSTHHAGHRYGIAALALGGLILAASSAQAIQSTNTEASEARNFDAREAANLSLSIPPSRVQNAAAESLRGQIPSLAVTYSANTGATHTVYNRIGYMSDAGPGEPLALGLDFVRQNLDLFGLSEADLAGYEITDSVFSKVTGATHIYLRQTHAGLPLFNGQLHLNINRDGRVISINNAFLPGLANSVNTLTPSLGAEQAVAAAAGHLNLVPEQPPRVLGNPDGLARTTRVEAKGVSAEIVVANLMWLPIRRGEARLVWNFQISDLIGGRHLDMNVDAVSGQVWTRIDWVSDAQYRVYEQPIADPDHTTPAPPADARTLAVDPDNATACPFGWHDTDGVAGAEFTTHRGNNVHAYEDSDGNNAPPGGEPDCAGTLDCDFDIDLSMAPSVYSDAAVTNLFYWTNILHDIQYQYGFDEAGGNFQVNNYGNGGNSGDDVRAEAQDGAGNCNANFFTPSDGARPRMQMFTCTNASPARDGDLDAVVIAHEFGHGISNRQVGGPSNVNCLGNTQQPGEGWSDWFALAYTAVPADLATDGRGIATYLFGQPANGPGIRQQLYSTDPGVNTWTYENILGAAIPHGIGSRWAQAIWEVYWALVDQHGFDADLYDAAGGSGNQRAMLYVNEGLKDTACGIIQAAMDNNGGQDVCLIWEAFADFGLGTDASTPGPGSTSATNGFMVPAECLDGPVIFSDGFEAGNTAAWGLTFP